MKKSVGPVRILNRQLILVLGVVLSVAAFGIVAWQASAKAAYIENSPDTPLDQKMNKDAGAARELKNTQDDRRKESLRAKAATGSPGKNQKKTIIVGSSDHNDTSEPLRKMVQLPLRGKSEERLEDNENPKIPHSDTHIDVPDEAKEESFVTRLTMSTPDMPGPVMNFDGIGFPGVACNCSPPDTDGEVGATQYVQMVNEGYQVFNKSTGASVLGPASIVSLWSGFGGLCETNGNGDPVVLYDQMANRWIITQFAGTSVPTDECIAVSTTSDATGTYNRYSFHLGTTFFDYPRLGVWPDGIYMSMNVFNTAGTAFLGPQAFAFDRTAMLAGTPATFVTPGPTGGPNEDSFLPADLDGSTLPPVGTACPFVETPFGGTYRTFLFHVDFAKPANSTFTLHASPTAAGFTELCPTGRGCIPQSGTAVSLDGIGDRLMHRLPYRIVGGVERIVGNFTVSSGGVAGIRWFELRNVTSGTESVFQESTFQPDTTWRWLGSAAQDQAGNLAIGYSASSGSINPQIRYTGRLAGDALNTLGQGESHIMDGAGSQTSSGNRWGDYSALTVDPVDDCTFWYTQEYYASTATVNWRTRIASFKYASCGGPPVAAVAFQNSAITTGNNLIEPGECNTVNIGLTNLGNAAATSVSATLSTSTPGVTVTSATSAYPDIASNGGVQTNTIPFQVSTDNTIACFSSINLTLTVTSAGGASPSVFNFTLPVGQAANPNYSFTSSTGIISPTGTLVTGSDQDDAVVTTTTPFAFTLYGKPVTSGQTITLGTNGMIQFVASGGAKGITNAALPSATFGATTTVLMPYWDDLDMSPVTTGGGIYTETTGVTPSRIFKVEWRAPLR